MTSSKLIARETRIYGIAAVERKIERKHIDVFVCSDDGNVYTAWWTEGCGWSTATRGWKKLGGCSFPPGAAVTAVSRKPNNLDLFVCGTDHHVYTKWWNQHHGWYKGWQDLGGAGDRGDLFSPGIEIAAVSRLPDKIDLFASSSTGDVYNCYWCGDSCCGGWSSLTARLGGKWKNLGGRYHRKSAAANAAVLSRGPYSLDVFFCGDNGLVRHKAWGGDKGDHWSLHWEILGGKELVAGGYVTAMARQSDHIDLFSCGADGCVYTSWWHQGRGWTGVRKGWTSLGGVFPPGSPVSAAVMDQDHLEIGVVGATGSLYSTWWTKEVGSWHHWTDIGGTSVQGGHATSLSLSPLSLDIFLLRSNGEVVTTNSGTPYGEMRSDRWASLGRPHQVLAAPFPTEPTREASKPCDQAWKNGVSKEPASKPKLSGILSEPATTNPPQEDRKQANENTPLSAVDSYASDVEHGELQDESDNITSTARQRKTDMWFQKFQNLVANPELGIGRGINKQLKVAILDSGIDTSIRQFNKEIRIRETISFIDNDPTIDRSGHGTYIAAIILQLTRNADLYIGKITNSSKVSPQEAIKAIHHARTKWGVDIISLSFGFDEHSGLGEEIDQCLNSGIAVFASASNDAGEATRTYPAKFQRVICLHSASWQGTPSHFNPPLEEYENFSTVGELIRPIWPSKDPKDDILSKYRCGTSYATPVAVSIAAFMIAYIQKTWPDCSWVIKPESPEGIKTVFKIMSTKIDGYDWISATAYIRHTKKEKIFGDLKQYLMTE